MRRSWKISNKPWRRLAIIAIPVVLFACEPAGNTGSGDVLVRVYDKYLYASEVEGIVPPGSSVRDSLTMVRTFIQNWVDKELIVKKAEENLPDDLKDFSSQLEEYRNSLIIFEYEKMLVRQELDTNILFEEVDEYYNQHKRNFVLKDDILRMQYLILHIDSPAYSKFRQYIRSEVQEEKDSLALYGSKYAESFNQMDDRWIDLEEMTEIVPLETYSFSDFIANRRFYEMNDSAYIYMIYFKDYKPADSISPIQFAEDEIRMILLNRRKSNLIKNMRQTVLQDAIEHNQVDVY